MKAGLVARTLLVTTCCLVAGSWAAPLTPKENLTKHLKTVTKKELEVARFLVGKLIKFQLPHANGAQPSASELTKEQLAGLRVESHWDVPLEAITELIEADIPLGQLRDFTMVRRSYQTHVYNYCSELHAKLELPIDDYKATGDQELIEIAVMDRVCALIVDSLSLKNDDPGNVFFRLIAKLLL